MREVLPDLSRWREAREEIAIATVIGASGSTPRPTGARLAVTRTGGMAGSVSGGCVESDVFERAMQVLDSGQPQIASYGIADELGFEVGLSCGGSIDVLIEPYTESDAWTAVREAIILEQPAVLATALAPQAITGRRIALLTEGKSVGAIDPSLDKKILAEAAQQIVVGGNKVQAYDGEEAQVFFEAFLPPPALYIVGATHTAIPLVGMAKVLGYRVTIIDARSIFATDERFPEADRIINAWPDPAFDILPLNAYTSVVILTHDPKFDLPTLSRVLQSDAPYIGAIGSRQTHEARREELRRRGFREDDLARIHAPVGLDIGAQTPEEVAVAILAEVVAVRHRRAGGSLRDSTMETPSGG